jgi:hypothetical protein
MRTKAPRICVILSDLRFPAPPVDPASRVFQALMVVRGRPQILHQYGAKQKHFSDFELREILKSAARTMPAQCESVGYKR